MTEENKTLLRGLWQGQENKTNAAETAGAGTINTAVNTTANTAKREKAATVEKIIIIIIIIIISLLLIIIIMYPKGHKQKQEKK